ncbi:MAG: alpha-N-acetylglucosaminidase C-terminal domain-containing protein [Candidatus Sumerlaeota bacterium]|nr:alpha-N-acetylglucosaminidase C-terminal domain-containing protein [Candidatus Sumerlaeota bacterium]
MFRCLQLIRIAAIWAAFVAACAAVEANPAQAAQGLVARLIPAQAEAFVFGVIPADNGKDVFEIEGRDGKTIIHGNSALSMAVGFNWYLKYYCHCNVSINEIQLNLPQPLPAVRSKLRMVGWAKSRYLLNYCTFGYSMPWWDWAQWERFIDWMALNGINLPLAVTGQEAVWRAVCRRLGMSDDEIREFLAGPPYLPFSWMGCLDGWGGPLPAAWVDKRAELEKKILARERELGMTPVLQGFTGHVPAAIAKKFPEAKMQKIHWIEWNTHLLDPTDPLFAKIAALFIEEQTRLFGTDHFYDADTFIEMAPPSGEPKYLAQMGNAILNGMTQSDPKAVWVFQTWPFYNQRNFWTRERTKAFMDSVPNDRMLALDLFCDSHPLWNKTEAFFGKPWVWCFVHNFGDATHLGGAFDTLNNDLAAARKDPASGNLAGVGMLNEGFGHNPPMFELMFEMAWRDKPVDLLQWFRDYAWLRYGKENEDARAAWRTLRYGVYSRGVRGRSIFTCFPTAPNPARHKEGALAEAWLSLMKAEKELGGADTYRYDLVNIARQTLVNHAFATHGRIADAFKAKDAAAYSKASKEFMQLMQDVDELLATRKEFLLGAWLEDAKRWGQTDAERARMEWNARRVLTLWGAGTQLRDYAAKEWSGMLSGYYAKRWEMFFKRQLAALESNRPFDPNALQKELFEFETHWADQRETYPPEPKGDSITVARKLWEKYSPEMAQAKAAVFIESLTTGKPATCSYALPGMDASLANDGYADDTEMFWGTDVAKDKEVWWQADLESATTVGRVVVVSYYKDNRFYGFTVETSLDGKTWTMASDRRDNKAPSTKEGYACIFAPRAARYVRVALTHNSANTGRHLVEVMAYEK